MSFVRLNHIKIEKDIIMPLTVTRVVHSLLQAPAMPGPIQGQLKTGAQSAIGHINAANIFGPHPATIVPDIQGWRVDRQAPPPNHVNLSVQRNGVGAPSTVATVFVPTRLNIAPPHGGVNDPVYRARIRELERVTRNGLEQSLASHQQVRDHGWYIYRYQIQGDFSA
jgi:hypothetical protein